MAQNASINVEKPHDSLGLPLKPLDLIRINEIPEQWYDDPGLVDLKEFEGCYGLITFFQNHETLGPKKRPGWRSEDCEMVHVLSRRIGETGEGTRAVLTWDFWLPSRNLTRLDYNYLILCVFAEYSWELIDSNGPGSRHYVVEGTEEFREIEKILQQSYTSLCEAHRAAAKALARN